MSDQDDLCFEVGPGASSRMSHMVCEKLIPDDTLDSLKHNHLQIVYLIETLARDKTSPYYEDELKFLNALSNIKRVYENNISLISGAVDECERIIAELDECCYYQVVFLKFIDKYNNKEASA